jgi:hypothetical protein
MGDICAENVIIFSQSSQLPLFGDHDYHWISGTNSFGGLRMNSQRIRLQKKPICHKGWFTVASQRQEKQSTATKKSRWRSSLG